MKLRLFSALFLALLFPASIAVSAPSPSAADAVRAAGTVTLPDVDQMLREGTENADETFRGFGGLHPENTGDRQELLQNGMGALFEPAVGAVVGCRDRTDPACRAVQILDRGFPERPEIREDILMGRDEVIEGAGGEIPPGVDNGTAGCRPVIVETKGTESTETCRTGGPFVDRACRRGPVEAGTTLSKRFACIEGGPTESSLTCIIKAALQSTSDFIERCFWGEESLLPDTEIVEKKEAVARALWPVSCEAPQAMSETVLCDEILVIESVPVCRPDSAVRETVKGGPGLMEDSCPEADAVTVEHRCGEGSRLHLTVKGFREASLTPGRRAVLRLGSVPACRATVSFLSEDCSTEACIAAWEVVIQYNNQPLGTMAGKAVYPDDSKTEEKKTWIDHCKEYR